MWAGSHKRHLPVDHINKLRQFINTGGTQYAAYASDAWAIALSPTFNADCVVSGFGNDARPIFVLSYVPPHLSPTEQRL